MGRGSSRFFLSAYNSYTPNKKTCHYHQQKEDAVDAVATLNEDALEVVVVAQDVVVQLEAVVVVDSFHYLVAIRLFLLHSQI